MQVSPKLCFQKKATNDTIFKPQPSSSRTQPYTCFPGHNREHLQKDCKSFSTKHGSHINPFQTEKQT